MISVELSEHERNRALDYEARVMQHVDRMGANYTGFCKTGRYFKGRCGEIAVRKWAVTNGLEFDETMNDAGVSDDQDFIFYFRDGRRCRIDVKSNFSDRATDLLVNVPQAARQDCDLYLSATGFDTGQIVRMQLWGVVPKHELVDRGPVLDLHPTPAYAWPNDLLPYSMDRLAACTRMIRSQS